ncbi:hypothetical protein F383_37671 [Gossypium arboreum]|nr:hypothetical protein F383_37671 [Gossypium arboreum]
MCYHVRPRLGHWH